MDVYYLLLFKNALRLSDADRARAFATTLASLEPFKRNLKWRKIWRRKKRV